MSKDKIKWTEQQLRAITERGRDVLVSASAGTGKTAVLAGRCVDIITEKGAGPDVLGMLVLTFTNAAAEQMRLRIGEQLKRRVHRCRDPKLREHLRIQLILLQGSDIGTIHSFCKRLITEYFYELDIDPSFRVIESDEQKLLKAEILEKTIDWAWRQSNLSGAMEKLLSRRDLRINEGFLSRIVEVSNYLDNVVSREDWYERAVRLAETLNPFSAEPGQEQKRIVAERLQNILNQLRSAQKLHEREIPDGDWAGYCEKTFIEPIQRCAGFLDSGDWDKCAAAIRDYKKPRVAKPKEADENLAEIIQKTVKAALDRFVDLGGFAVINPDYLDKVGGLAGLQSKVVIELVKKFDQLYTQAKKTFNCLDFADLEHYALRLLTDADSSDTQPSPSETALQLRGKYKYIFVDEYQDINPVQQRILELLGGQDNVFVVGDVKQSIYAFRGAQPGIFAGGLSKAGPESAGKALRVDLSDNWRSVKGVLDFVNSVFSRIMTAGFGEIDYDESAMLKAAPEKAKAKDGEVVVEFHILDELKNSKGPQSEEQAETFSDRQRQAAVIARRIQEMVGAGTGRAEFQVYDEEQKGLRDVGYGDIVVLMRSVAGKANNYVEIFQMAGVPVSCEAATGYFEATEIRDIICLLKVLDNPRRDIELSAVLRSPIFKVSDSELAKIRIHNKTEQSGAVFCDCVLEYCESGPDTKLVDRLKEILSTIERWRTIAGIGHLADLIWQIYRETNYLSFVTALPNGQRRRANLLKLHERAIQFSHFASSSGAQSLTRFVQFIEKVQEMGQDWGSAEPEAESKTAVRIISVHKSKGLEFPVVFLAELDRPFNKTDLKKDLLADSDYAIGLQVIDSASNSKFKSLGHQIIAERKYQLNLAEEARILYVAMTRAKCRLILSACKDIESCAGFVRKGFYFAEKSIPDWQLRYAQSHLEWLLLALSGRQNLHTAFDTSLKEQPLGRDLFDLRVYGEPELDTLTEFISKLKVRKPRRPGSAAKKSQPTKKDLELFAKLKDSLDWKYQFADITELPAKSSVTQLALQQDEREKIDYEGSLQRKPNLLLPADFAESTKGRLIGSATHDIIANLDLSKPITAEAIEKTKEELLSGGIFTSETADKVDVKSIAAFFDSELGRAALEDGNRVWREWPFTFSVPASQVLNKNERSRDTGCGDGETIIVQGIIDMLIETADGLLVIDFKTDRISGGQVNKRALDYRQQLTAYGRAAEAILKTPVKGCWLYFLSPGCAHEIK